MIQINTNLLKELTNKINKGVDNNKTIKTSELLELKVESGTLSLAVTNTQFYLNIKLENATQTNDSLHVTINADTFTKLISKTTTETITLSVVNDNLCVKGNGEYIFPLELNKDGNIRELPAITIDPQTTFEISGDTLYSIYSFGSHELVNDVPVDAIQKYYYVDNEGAITYTESPYINNFRVNTTFKFLLNDRLAQLLTLFRNQKVIIGISKNSGEGIYQNKVSFACDNISLVAYIPDDNLTDKYPAVECRSLQESPYAGMVTISRQALASALDRLNIFSSKDLTTAYSKAGKLTFTPNGLEISSVTTNNMEFIPYVSTENYSEYTCYMNLTQLQRHAKASVENQVAIHYGNDLCLMFKKENYSQILVEMENPNTRGE